MESTADLPQYSPLEPIFAGHNNLPKVFQDQFLHSVDGTKSVELVGTMSKIWHKPRFGFMFRFVEKFGILISNVGSNVAVRLKIFKNRTNEGTPYYGWRRYFDFPNKPTFDTVVIYDNNNQFLLDLVGNKKQFYMAWDAKYHPEKRMMTLDNRSYGLKFRGRVLWLPQWFWKWTVGYEKFNQYADPVHDDITHINLRVIHPIFGKVFQYKGTFKVVVTK